MAKIIIEVIKARTLAREHRVFETEQIQVGRAFDNDLIIPDSYVSPNHIVFFRDEDGWKVKDLDTTNGIFVNGVWHIGNEIRLKSGDEIIIGKTYLRILLPTHPVPPAMALIHTHPLIRRISQPLYSWILAVVMAVVFLIDQYLSTPDKLMIEKFATGAIAVVILVIVWAGIWAFVGRLIRHRPQFSAQLSVSCLFIITTMTLDYLTDLWGYNTGNFTLVELVAAVLYAITFSIFLVWNLTIAVDFARNKQIFITSLLSFVIALIVFLTYFGARTDFSDSPRFNDILLPPYAKIAPNTSIDQFIEDSQSVFNIKIKN